jgi:tRNA-modifying protein YgfZ
MAVTDIHAREYEVLTTGCAVVDRSERGKLALTGSEAKSFLQGQVTQDVEALEPGRGAYAVFLTPKGKMLGDLRVLDAGPELLLDCERLALQDLFNLIRRAKIGYDVELHKRTLERGLLSLAGPRARDVAAAFVPRPPAAEHEHLAAAGVRWIATDLGVDALCEAAQTDALREQLVAAGAQPVSAEAAEIVRVERGRPRFGVDLEPEAVIPQEAGLNDRAVSFTKGCYVGQETVARLFYKGRPNRHLRGLRPAAPVPSGSVVRDGERELGRVGSSVISPRLGPIALALVRREAGPGAEVAVGEHGVRATVVDLPFGGGGEEAA